MVAAIASRRKERFAAVAVDRYAVVPFVLLYAAGFGTVAGLIVAASGAVAGAAAGGLNCLAKLSKNSSAIFLAVPSIRRDSICASLPPT